jgi:hypothetical protein
VLPISNSSQALHKRVSRSRPEAGSAPSVPGGAANEPLAPIGSERLRALREAIQNGTYPAEEDVLGGLDRLLETPDAPDDE